MKAERPVAQSIESITVPPKYAARVARAAMVLAAVGVAMTVAAMFNDVGRARLGFSYLLGFAFLWSIVLGSLFFVGLQHLTRSVWSVVIRRVAEMLVASMWTLAVAFVPILLLIWFGRSIPLFSWAERVDISSAKAIYLNPSFFAIRAVVFFAVWIAFSRFFVNGSLRQDHGEMPESAAARLRRASSPFMPAFALTVTFAAFDWLMSLDPSWYSTIFGVYVFSGMVVASLSAITLAVISLRRQGYLGEAIVTDDHLYNLGGLIFAFVCFWAYIAFSQFMLIWYGNIPEETVYYVRRLTGGWWGVSALLVMIRFVVPFFLLLSRPAKMNPRLLVVVAVLMLFGQFVDLYWMIVPEFSAQSPVLSWTDLGPTLLLIGVLGWSISRFMQKHPMMAVGDPMFERSRLFRL
jgi:hypothetical protein